jgi:TNF receptor-associated factor 3
LSTYSNFLQIGGQTGDNANETVSDLERRVAAMEHQNTLREVEMADHDLKINMLETTSYDGIFFWKIDDFGRRLQDAVAGRCLSIYSSQFYVGRYGYKVITAIISHLCRFSLIVRGL